MLMAEIQGYGRLLLWYQMDSKEQGRKSLSPEVTMTSLLTEILPLQLVD